HALREVPVVTGCVAAGLWRALGRQEEASFRAGDDDDANRVVVSQLRQRRADLDVRPGECLAVLRLDRHGGDLPAAGDRNSLKLAHGCLVSNKAPSCPALCRASTSSFALMW